MRKIITTKLIEASKAKDYQEKLNAAIEELQSENLEVEVKYFMCPSAMGTLNYMYSSVVIGRQE